MCYAYFQIFNISLINANTHINEQYNNAQWYILREEKKRKKRKKQNKRKRRKRNHYKMAIVYTISQICTSSCFPLRSSIFTHGSLFSLWLYAECRYVNKSRSIFWIHIQYTRQRSIMKQCYKLGFKWNVSRYKKKVLLFIYYDLICIIFFFFFLQFDFRDFVQVSTQ